MDELMDSFAWAHRLECPQSALTVSTKKVLSKGIVGLLWDHAADKLHPAADVLAARKNILLYKLKNESQDTAIQNVRNTLKLKKEREALVAQINEAQKKQEKQDFALRQKCQQHLRNTSTRESLQTKKELLLIKENQLRLQVRDCEKMRQICERLMPSTCDTITHRTIQECLASVSSISSITNKKQVWHKISEILFPITIPVLWNVLSQCRALDTEKVIQLGAEASQTVNRSEIGENIDIGIARICGQHITAVSKRLIHETKANQHQEKVMEYINKIEMATQSTGMQVDEWLVLALEVRKLEAEQSVMLDAQKNIQEILEDQFSLSTELNQTMANIQNIYVQVNECTEAAQKSLTLLKGASAAIEKSKEKLLVVLQNIALLRAENQDTRWLDIDLSAELEDFHDSLDIDALRKIALSGDVGVYRHAKCCMSQAPLLIAAPQNSDYSDFPMIRAPVFYLLDYYKAFMKSIWFRNREPKSPGVDIDQMEEWSPKTANNNVYSTIELLGLAELACEKTEEQIQQFNATYEAWMTQAVQQVLMFDDRTVDGATFKEWQQRYNAVEYMMKRSK